MPRKLGIGLVLAVAVATWHTESAAMTYELIRTSDGIDFVSAKGRIADDERERFEAFVASQAAPVNFVTLNSNGGSVSGGIALGEALRHGGYTTFIPSIASCLSACAFAFVGGAERAVGPTGRLGVHQFRWDDEAFGADSVEKAQAMSGVLVAYFGAMGVDQGAIIKAMMTPPAEMYVFTAEELERYRLVTPERAAVDPGDCPFPDGVEVKDPLGLYPACRD